MPPTPRPEPLRKVTVALPARNERKHIGPILASLGRWRENHPNRDNIRLLVVNDGSTDHTPDIARAAGVEVISSDPKDPRRRMGKAEALRVAAMHARDAHNSQMLVTLDSDILNIDPRGIDELITPIATQDYHMSVADSVEGVQLSRRFSGNRAFYLPALNPWINGNVKWKPVKGYGLETGFNRLIPIEKQNFLKRALFRQEPPNRNPGDFELQAREIFETSKGIDERIYPALHLRTLRSQDRAAARKFRDEWHGKRGESHYVKKPKA